MSSRFYFHRRGNSFFWWVFVNLLLGHRPKARWYMSRKHKR